mmetsp:Transcript_9130/g.24746  ORF Transcript_9130/g.24746 Transcript_9130/m.24746 type:complete len:518 (-) Transcript_9130:447-2000(-)
MRPRGDLQAARLFLLLLVRILHPAWGDLPVHCLRHQLIGEWDFFLGPPSPHRSSCGHHTPDVEDLQPPVFLAETAQPMRLTLSSPSLAQSSTDDSGRWTMIYDEAFEVNVDGLSFLAFARFDLGYSNGIKMNVSRCGETQLGWYRNEAGTQWGCYYAKKQSPVTHEHYSLLSFVPPRMEGSAQYDEVLQPQYHNSFAANLNLLQDLWTAKAHERWFGKSLREINNMAGIFRSFSSRQHREMEESQAISFLQKSSAQPRRLSSVEEVSPHADNLPTEWDWRNVDGHNYLDSVLDQGECGSCYAVATTRMLSARHRFRRRDPTLEAFSINFPLYCSEYNQGCNGGYAFLMARWSQDVGLVPQSCGNYTSGGRCEVRCSVGGLQKRWRADNHHYVGGYYGAASEQEMMRELVRNGPLVASFEPKADIMYYSGGIYKSVPQQRTEWEKVDHAVLLIGFGEEQGRKYWTLQNSWGEEWGERGFFRMARGTDESGIESIVVGADVVEATAPHNTVLLEFAQRL